MACEGSWGSLPAKAGSYGGWRLPKTVFDPHDTDRFGNLDANEQFLADKGLLRDGIRVLEIGSGRGALLGALHGRGVDVVGIEPDPALAADARALAGPLPLVRMSGDRLGFRDGVFDLVVSFDVFEHIADSDAHLAEVRRVLRPGGAYALQTPNKWTNSVFETIRWRSFTKWKVQHCALHSMTGLERRLRSHGFEPEFADVPVVNEFFREKLRRYLGPVGPALLAIANPDKWPRRWRTNFFVIARRRR